MVCAVIITGFIPVLDTCEASPQTDELGEMLFSARTKTVFFVNLCVRKIF